MKSIGYNDFIRLFHVHNPQDWGGYRVAADGVYIIMPDPSVYLTPVERDAITRHPAGNPSAPLLSFPCTVNNMKKFLKEQAMGMTIEDLDFKHHLAESDKDEESPGDPWKKIALEYAPNIWMQEFESRGRNMPIGELAIIIASRLGRQNLLTKTKQPITGGYVERHVLRGWKPPQIEPE